MIYSDVCGHIQVDSIGGNIYFVTFINDFNIKLCTYMIKKKIYVIKVLTKFKAKVERHSGQNIKTFRTYGAGEYLLNDFDTLCGEEWIMHELSGEVMSTATYMLNRCLTKRLDAITLEECWFGFNPR